MRMRMRPAGSPAVPPRARFQAEVPAAQRGPGRRRRPRRTGSIGLVEVPRKGVTRMRFETRAIHAGQEPEPAYGAVNVPIYQTSTYAQDAVGRPKRFDYARGGNPPRETLQDAIASLEGGALAFSFASGLAAESTLLLTLEPGAHVVLGDDV